MPCWAETSGASSDRMSLATVMRSFCPGSMRVNLARLVLSQSCSLFFPRGVTQVTDHFVNVVFEDGQLTAGIDANRSGEVALRHRRGHFGDGADLGGEVRGELIDVVGQVFPGAGGARHAGLAAQFALDPYLTRHGSDLRGERGQGVDHAVDGVGQRGNLALSLQR